MEFHYTVRTEKRIPEAIEALERAFKERNFSVLWHLHVNKQLAEKGLSLERQHHIFEVCNAQKAKEVLETSPMVGYFLPCKAVVYEGDDGATNIGLLLPSALMGMLGDERLHEVAGDVEETLRAAIDAAAK